MLIHSVAFLLLTVAGFHRQVWAQTNSTPARTTVSPSYTAYPFYPTYYYGSMTFVRQMPQADQRELISILDMANLTKEEVLKRMAIWASDKGVTAKYDNYTIYQQRAFDAYYEAATTNFTGMALSICKQLCELRQDIKVTLLDECKKKRELTADLYKDPFMRGISFAYLPPMIDGVPTPAGCYPVTTMMPYIYTTPMPRFTGTPQPSPTTTSISVTSAGSGGAPPPAPPPASSGSGGGESPNSAGPAGGAPFSMPVMPSINAISMPTFGSGGMPDMSAAFKGMDQGQGPKRMMDEANPGTGPGSPEGIVSGPGFPVITGGGSPEGMNPGVGPAQAAEDQPPAAQLGQPRLIF